MHSGGRRSIKVRGTQNGVRVENLDNHSYGLSEVEDAYNDFERHEMAHRQDYAAGASITEGVSGSRPFAYTVEEAEEAGIPGYAPASESNRGYERLDGASGTSTFSVKQRSSNARRE